MRPTFCKYRSDEGETFLCHYPSRTKPLTPLVLTAIQRAKSKEARLRLMKERNERYLAEQRVDVEADDEFVEELNMGRLKQAIKSPDRED
jgi:hypothetical protein